MRSGAEEKRSQKALLKKYVFRWRRSSHMKKGSDTFSQIGKKDEKKQQMCLCRWEEKRKVTKECHGRDPIRTQNGELQKTVVHKLNL